MGVCSSGYKMSNVLTSTETDKFCSAINHDDEEALTQLLSQYGTQKIMDYTAEWYILTISNPTPLLYAVYQKKPSMVDQILRYSGTNVDAKTSHGQTSLFIACCDRQPCIEIIISLINHNADVNTASKNKITPLMMSSGFDNVLVMNLLIKAGANIDALDYLGRTALIYAIHNNKSEALKVLLCCNAKLSIPTCPRYNPLSVAIDRHVDGCVDILIPYCKSQKNFGEALMSAMLRKRLDVFQILILNGAKLPVNFTTECLERVIYDADLEIFFEFLWSNINHEKYLNPKTFAMLIENIFKQRNRVYFFKSSLKMIMNTPVLYDILTGKCEHLMLSSIFSSISDPNYDWTLCKDILLEFCEFVNKLGIIIRKNDLIIFICYFQQSKCQFITELLAVCFKYNPDLVTLYDVIYLSNSLNDLKLTQQLLYNCSDFHLFYGSVYALDNVKKFSEDMLKFFLQRFTPTKNDKKIIRSFKKFDNINIESLKVPSLMEITRNTIRKINTNVELKELINDFNIYSDFEDILYFKTIMNRI